MALSTGRQPSLFGKILDLVADVSRILTGGSAMSNDLEIPIAVTEMWLKMDAVCKTSARKDVSPVMRTHVLSLMQIAATSVAALSGLPECPLASPHAPVQIAYDASGNMRLECLHVPTHCWSLSGAKGTC